MAYLTHADIEQRLGAAAYVQLTDDAGAGVADEALVGVVREAAEGELDSYLARRFRTPLDVAGFPELRAVLASIALDLVEYRLHARRPPPPESVVRRYLRALDWLAAVGAGDIALPTDRALPGNSAAGPPAQVTGNAAVLSREAFKQL